MPEWTFTEVEPGVLALDGTSLRIYYNRADAKWGAPAELWYQDQHLSTWAKLDIARDMAGKTAALLAQRDEKIRRGKRPPNLKLMPGMPDA